MTQPNSPEAPPRRKRGRPPIEGLAERRTAEILAVAIALFAKHGYANTDLQVVADKLKVGKGTLYRYFPSKKKMFQAALDHIIAGMRSAVDEAVAAEQDALDQMHAGVRAYLAYFDKNPSYVELIIQERAEVRDRKKPTYFQHRDKALARWQEFYRRLISEGRFRDMPVERIAEVIANALYGTMCSNYLAGHDKTLCEQAEDILDVTLHGLLSPTESAQRVSRAATSCKESAQ